MHYQIVNDIYASSPREWDNVSLIVTAKGKYSHLGDEIIDGDDFFNTVQQEYNPAIIYPLYVYDHSGLHLSITTNGLPDVQWDVSLIGAILVTNEEGLSKDRMHKCLLAELKEYNAYLAGEVYGYVVYDNDLNEIEQCWGFYDYEECREEAELVISSLEGEPC